MLEWDRLVMFLLASGVAICTGWAGWRSWRAKRRQAGVGAFLLALATVALAFLLNPS